MEPKFKIGQKVRHKMTIGKIDAGAGYKPGITTTIRSIDKYSDEGGNVYFFKEYGGIGAYERALEPVDSIINNYELY